MSQELMAFWDYDIYPYTLHSEVLEFDEKPGVVKVKGYGGSRFKYRHICPLDIGKEAALAIEELKKDYSAKNSELQKAYNQKLKDTLNKYGVSLPRYLKEK